ncbi:ABC-three component system middle component 6 [Acinetobacter pittii]|uniref:ABC-three component system middle component 6 n=1 Tax=Acinetobacter pittii TaxID=48296 RepID=UPI001BC897AA|nr:ABC-three component system middle component 6 [Acinetobacter pittii]
MLILTERNPETSLYYIGSEILKILSEYDGDLYLSEIYNKFSKKKKIGLNRLILSLDWLFMIGLVEESKEGKISICT